METLFATSADLAGERGVIARAEAVRAAVAPASGEIESTRRLPPALLDKLHEAGLFRLLLPRSSNGIETRGKSIEEIDRELNANLVVGASAQVRQA